MDLRTVLNNGIGVVDGSKPLSNAAGYIAVGIAFLLSMFLRERLCMRLRLSKSLEESAILAPALIIGMAVLYGGAVMIKSSRDNPIDNDPFI
ncbi:MAG: hypothetical protein ACP5HD_06390 [Thermoproteus sp.]